MVRLEDLIRDVPDFPTKGIVFKDITPLLADPQALRQAADEMARPFAGQGVRRVVGIESRGFVFASLVAERLGAGLVPARKPGKLPWNTIRRSYDLEYGSAAIEVHTDAIQPGEAVLLVDDLLATGGTMAAAWDLAKQLGGRVAGATFLIELAFLNGRQKLEGLDVRSLIRYE